MTPGFRHIDRNYRDRIEKKLKAQKAAGGEPLRLSQLRKWVKPASSSAISIILRVLEQEKLVERSVVEVGNSQKVPGWEWIGK